jgi:hypothetical protein
VPSEAVILTNKDPYEYTINERKKEGELRSAGKMGWQAGEAGGMTYENTDSPDRTG